LEYAACYSPICELDQHKYIVVLQCAVKPGEIMAQGYPGSNYFSQYPQLSNLFQTRYKDQNSEWTFPSQCVRPYAILIGDVEKLEEVYGKDAIGNRRRGRGKPSKSHTDTLSKPLKSGKQHGATMNSQTQPRSSTQPETTQRTSQRAALLTQPPQQPPQPKPRCIVS
jgi:hypothetical protein